MSYFVEYCNYDNPARQSYRGAEGPTALPELAQEFAKNIPNCLRLKLFKLPQFIPFCIQFEIII